jgi:hypothetical protein
MLQSCGRSSVRQEPSANEGASAPLGSPRRNFHRESAANSNLGAPDGAPIERRTSDVSVAHSAISMQERNFTKDLFLVLLLGAFERSEGLAMADLSGRVTRARLRESFRETADRSGVRIPTRLCFPMTRDAVAPRSPYSIYGT